ncbi:MAG: type I-C CRISPR-associated endonuclease Cas1c [Bryobacteraceae bacterium]
MKKLLNTLYVTTQGAYLHKEGETLVVRVEQETRLQIPVHTLGAVVGMGAVTASGALLGFCAERGVTVAFLTEHGRFLARVEGPVSGNVLLRRTQYRWADDPSRSASLALRFVAAKVANSRQVLLRAQREGEPDPHLESAAKSLASALERLSRSPENVDTIRGLEGEAAAGYFGVFDHMIVAQKLEFQFRGRSRRPPLDPINALLSFLYTLLVADARGALECVGLDPQVGYLHRDRPGRPGLALDLMEELRPYLADRLALTLINRKQVQGAAFRTTESGAVVMDDATRKEVLIAYQKRKQEEILHPFLNEKIPIGLIPFVQASLLARHMRGDLPEYPAFFTR